MEYTVKECTYLLPKVEFFEEWLKHADVDKLFRFVNQKYDLSDISDKSLREIKMKVAATSKKFKEKWYTCGKSRDRFLSRYIEFLKIDIKINVCKHIPLPSTSSQCSKNVGRPKVEFKKASFKTKRRRVEDLVQNRSALELTTAAEIALRSCGNRNAAKVIKNSTENRGNDIYTAEVYENTNTTRMRCLTNDEALAYYIDTKSTSNSYKLSRKWSLKAGHNLYPSYYSLAKSKKACCPSNADINITETRATINLQSIMNLTAKRILEVQINVLNQLMPLSSLTLISKWGCDGSSGHSTYKQKFSSSECSDEYLFVFSFVPIRLTYGSKIVWQNPRPSSTMYCRPIKLIFAKESSEFTTKETHELLDEINKLVPTKNVLNGREILIHHKMLLTMVDGKVCNALTETLSSQKCYICGATPKEMNLTKGFSGKEENYGFGLSTLHAWIRCFECMLHISYRLDVKKWQIRDVYGKALVKQRSNEIKSKFKREMGLIVDKPKPGCGSTNDGNTARRFFHNHELSSQITGLNHELISNLNTILIALSSGFKINLTEFKKYTEVTTKIYLQQYSWYYMPVTIHKILMHGAEVIASSLLPIGQLSEEAQEARHKDCRRFRQDHTRKCTRESTMQDLLTMLLITSDPLISSLINVPKKKVHKYPREVLNLLIPSEAEIERTAFNNCSITLDSSESDSLESDSNLSASY